MKKLSKIQLKFLASGCCNCSGGGSCGSSCSCCCSAGTIQSTRAVSVNREDEEVHNCYLASPV